MRSGFSNAPRPSQRAYCVERGMSQEAFADLVGVHRTYMGGGERGERNLTLPSLERIHEVIGVQAIELLMVGLIGLG